MDVMESTTFRYIFHDNSPSFFVSLASSSLLATLAISCAISTQKVSYHREYRPIDNSYVYQLDGINRYPTNKCIYKLLKGLKIWEISNRLNHAAKFKLL